MRLIIFDVSSVFWTFAAVARELRGPYELTLGKVRRFAEGFDRVVIACDSGRSFRVTMSPRYKAGRPPKPPHLVEQLRGVIDVLRGEAHVIEAPPWGEDPTSGDPLFFEADDVIGTVAAWASSRGHHVRIVSEDWDLAQLVNELVELQKPDARLFGPAEIEAEKGVPPRKIVDLKALAGDTSDGYKPYPGERAGKKGIGEGVAAKLIQLFGGAIAAVDAVLVAEPDEETKKRLAEVPPNVIATIRRCGAHPAVNCAELAAICTAAPIDVAAVEAPHPTRRPTPPTPHSPAPQAPTPRHEQSRGQQAMTAPSGQTTTNGQHAKPPAAAAAKGPRMPVITRKRDTSAMKTILTGRSGVGKTHFASTIPNVFIIAVEEGLKGCSPEHDPDHFDEDDLPRSIEALSRLIDFFMTQNKAPGPDQPRPWRHLVLDSMTGIEKLVNAAAMQQHNATDMEGKEYKAIWATAFEIWTRFQAKLDAVRRAGINVWIIAHAAEIIEAVAETGATYRRWDVEFRGTNKTLAELKLLWRSWANDVFFLEWAASVQKNGKGHRAIGKLKGRVLLTRETGTHYAKTRYRLPPVIAATWEDFARALKAGIPAPEPKLRAEIEALLGQLGEERPEIEAALTAAKGANALAALLSRVQGLIAANSDEAEDPAEDAEGAPAAAAQTGAVEEGATS